MQCPAVRTPLVVVAKLQPGPMGAVIPQSCQAISVLLPCSHFQGLQSNYGSNDAIAFIPWPPAPLSLWAGYIRPDMFWYTVFFFYSLADPWGKYLLQLGHAPNKSSNMPRNTSLYHDMFSFCPGWSSRSVFVEKFLPCPSLTMIKCPYESNLHMIWESMWNGWWWCHTVLSVPVWRDLFDVVNGGGRVWFWRTKFGELIDFAWRLT